MAKYLANIHVDMQIVCFSSFHSLTIDHRHRLFDTQMFANALPNFDCLDTGTISVPSNFMANR